MKSILKTLVFLAIVSLLVACAPKAQPAAAPETATQPAAESTPAPAATPAEQTEQAATEKLETTEPANESMKKSLNASTNTTMNVSSKTAKTVQVGIEGNAFKPAVVLLNKGDSITWTNKDSTGHSVAGGSFSTGVLKQNETKTVAFDTVGTFTYACTIHPSMKGKILVK